MGTYFRRKIYEQTTSGETVSTHDFLPGFHLFAVHVGTILVSFAFSMYEPRCTYSRSY